MDCLSWETQSRPGCYGPNTLRKNPSFGGGGSSLPLPSYLHGQPDLQPRSCQTLLGTQKGGLGD